MGVSTFLTQGHNKLQILRMNEHQGITKELEIDEPWPATKILWLPNPEEVFAPNRDLLATSSDFLRLYFLQRDENDCFQQDGQCV